MKKIFIALLCCMLLVSCGGGNEVSDISGEVSEESENPLNSLDPLSVLPDGQFKGEKTVIWTTDLSVAKPENAYDTALKKVMQERIDAIENKLDTEIVIEKKTSAEITNALRSDGEHPDIILMPSSQSALNSADGLYANLWSLPYFNKAAEALGGAAEEQTINNSLYMLTAPFNMIQQNSLVVYANRTLIEQAGMRSPAYSVAEGDWTYDKMYEYNKVFKKYPSLKQIFEVDKNTGKIEYYFAFGFVVKL